MTRKTGLWRADCDFVSSQTLHTAQKVCVKGIWWRTWRPRLRTRLKTPPLPSSIFSSFYRTNRSLFRNYLTDLKLSSRATVIPPVFVSSQREHARKLEAPPVLFSPRYKTLRIPDDLIWQCSSGSTLELSWQPFRARGLLPSRGRVRAATDEP